MEKGQAIEFVAAVEAAMEAAVEQAPQDGDTEERHRNLAEAARRTAAWNQGRHRK